jgi:hypothetical protein
MTIAKLLATAIGSTLLSLCVTAQNNSGIIKGSLKDSANKQVLSLATVTVFIAKDTSIVTYRLSDPNGNFRVPSLPLDKTCRVLVSYSGYRVYRKEFTLTKESPQLDFGTILLINDPKHLDEVIVLAERPPVSVRRDTIEFNASSFKTLPSALVEDLLKKLPGIDVDADGNITVKGKPVNRLLVDGKEFFGGDPKIATKNLPANIVDKVQVMNDKEQQERNPDMPESELGQVVNIKLKRSIKEGWFGKAYAGAGTNKRHETGAILNIFRDTMQVSVLGYSNNINKPGFGITDIQKIGGFQRSGFNSMMVMSDGGFALNGVSFGATGQGLQRSTGGGMNFNTQFGKKLTMNLQYFYGQINSKFRTISNTKRYFRDTVLTSLGDTRSDNVSMNHRIGGTFIWKADSLTTITFRPGVTFTTNRNFSEGVTITSENYRGKINNSLLSAKALGKNTNYSSYLFLNRNFKKRGRNLSLSWDITTINNDNNNFMDGEYSLYEGGVQEDSVVNQLRHTGGDNIRSYSNINFAEPLNKKLTLRVTHTAEFLKERNDIDFFSKDGVSGKYDQFNQTFSNGIERDGWKNTSSASLVYRNKKFVFNPGLYYLTASFHNNFTKNPSIKQRFNYIYPSLSVTLGTLNFSYRASIQEPRANDLQQVIDISNPFNQQYGNPNLKPAVSQNISINANKFNPKSGNSYSVYANGNHYRNAVMREITIDKNGLQTSRPVNVSGTYSLYSYISYNYQYKLNKDYKLSFRPSISGNYSKNFISVNRNRSVQNNLGFNSALSVGLNYMDKIELNQRYSQNYREAIYEKKSGYKNIYLLGHSIESELVIRMPKHVVWENLINYNYNPQVAPGIRKSSVRWNAGLSYLFLKEEKGQLKLSVYDLLNQNINVYRYTGENFVTDIQTTTLTRYYMLSFIYNLRNFTGGKVGGKDRSMFFF